MVFYKDYDALLECIRLLSTVNSFIKASVPASGPFPCKYLLTEWKEAHRNRKITINVQK